MREDRTSSERGQQQCAGENAPRRSSPADSVPAALRCNGVAQRFNPVDCKSHHMIPVLTIQLIRAMNVAAMGATI
jgi:hypothetical protein